MYVELAILTKSSKNKGYCVAGIDMRNGQWIRLTSADESTHGALFQRDMQYPNREICQILDIARVQISGNNPSKYQPENVLIDQTQYWEKIGRCTIADILRIHPPEIHKFIFGSTRPYTTEAKIGNIGYSLALVEVNNLSVSQTINSVGKPKVKVSFLYGSNWYNNMSVTDPAFYNVPDGTQISNAVLVISLPDAPFPGEQYYKFIAQIYL